MKLEKINLSILEVEFKDDDFEMVEKEKETVPVVLTNRALNYAHENGIIESSLISDLIGLSNMTDENMEMLEDIKILKTIYTGYIGGQFLLGKIEPDHTFSEFTERYHTHPMEQVQIYQKLLIGKDNNFVKEIEKSTKKGTEKGEKK